MCSQCDDDNNVNPILIAEGAVTRAKRVDGYVRNGIAFLDKLAEDGVIESGWADRVDLVKLDLRSVGNCMLGQVFAPLAQAEYQADVRDGNDYAYLVSGYDYAQRIIDERDEYEITLGFNSFSSEWNELKAAWTFHIRNMRTV